ncbi:MAG: hypothetical protein RhofKO_36640 [Rhodothermales bacterium]
MFLLALFMPAASNPDLDTEARILEAAHRVFLRKGTAGARMQEIADEADVNRALLHYYYRSKQKLADAVFLRAARTLFPQLLMVLGSDLSLEEKVRQAIAIEIPILQANPYMPGYLIAEFQYRADDLKALLGQVLPLEQVRAHVFGTLQRQLDEAADVGTFRPMRAEDFMITLMSQMIFPFAAAPMLEAVLGLDHDARMAMIDRRRADLADAVLRSCAS